LVGAATPVIISNSLLLISNSVLVYLSIYLSMFVHNFLLPDLETKWLGQFQRNLPGRTAMGCSSALENIGSLDLSIA